MADRTAADGAGVIFDVDGTLLDTNYLHVLAWSAAFGDNGFRIETADIHRAIGLPSDSLVERLVQEQRPDLMEAHSDHFDRLRERYGVHAVTGAGDLLRRCAASGWTVVLSTSADKDDLDWMLPLIGADDVIAGTTTSGDVPHGKPHPDAMVTAMDAHGLAAERTLAVGDSVWDMRSARRAGIDCVGLTAGGISGPELQDAGAAEVHDDPAALLGRFRLSLLGVRAPQTQR
ncbi:HAD family hydrolase [Flexivirga caeni]|uniref:HAD family hydrolase n=1 Tax=Flexivirga caeni TaxID=2294115 RepID=A0A3M9MBF5_9MICO|nr:HAD family hydrolase [Flexivirga caeni]RNI22902.1 HAD family hydrolase [Flexivirga caeni]